MAKSKNHTNHNATVKTHKNGIKKAPPVHKFRTIRGSWLPALVNARFVRKANQKAAVVARKDRLKKFRATIKK